MSRIRVPRLDLVTSTEDHDQKMDELVAAFAATRKQLAADDQEPTPTSDGQDSGSTDNA
ncbi:MAG TPA: hypothetical protein VFE65_11115 [Pseudonocardia sp.]|jgi:hypothetical protein|nr:hypothetical protein [Pseudonocardia sp.]